MILKNFTLSVLLLLATLLFGAGSVIAGESPYVDAYKAGQDLEKTGKFAEARAEFEKALAIEGLTPDETGQVLIKVGACYINEKKDPPGIAALEKARAVKGISNQTKIQANILLGQKWEKYSWTLKQAKDAYTQILELPETTAEQKKAAQKAIVQALMGLKQFAEARSMMMTLAANPTLTPAERLATQISIGTTCMLEGDYPMARTELTKVMGMEGISEAEKADMQLHMELSHDFEAAMKKAAPGPEKIDAQIGIGLAYEARKKNAEARAEFEKALDMEGITPDKAGQTLIKIGTSYINDKNDQLGSVSLVKACAVKGISNQTKIQANILLGQLWMKNPWTLKQAKDAYTQILELPEATAEQKKIAQKGMVRVLLFLKQFAEMHEMLMTLAANPDLTPAEKLATQISIGTNCMLQKKYPEARSAFINASAMEGISEADKADIQLQMGICYYEENDLEHAKPELQKVLTMPGANMQQVRNDGWWGSYTPSREANLRLRKINPDDGKEKTILALFIGSSMTFRGGMPFIVEQLSASAPAGRPRIISGTYTRGGTGIEYFWDDGDARNTARGMIASVPWDVVVLETFHTRSAESNMKYGKLFCDLARSRNIKPVFYESQVTRASATSDVLKKFHDDEVELGKTLQGPLAPVVLAEMLYLGSSAPTAEQMGTFYDDWIHPSEKGVYLVAYCIYSAITGYSPVGLYHPKNISDEDARALQEAAWKAVQESNPELKPWTSTENR